MSDTFSINVITSAGASLIAQATSANPIVFVDTLSCTLAAVDAADLASKAASWYDGISGTISSASATGTIAKVTVRYGNAGVSAQAVKSICLRARLSTQSDADAIILAAMSDSDSEIVFPSSASPTQIIRFIFSFAIDASGTITTVYADGATMADLDRFVSMYKAGDPTQGEDQHIRGYKYFYDPILFNENVTIQTWLEASDIVSYDTLEVGQSDGNPGSLTVYGDITVLSDNPPFFTLRSELDSHAARLRASNDTLGFYDENGNYILALSATGAANFTGNVAVGSLTGTAPNNDLNGVTSVPVGGLVMVWGDEDYGSPWSIGFTTGVDVTIPASTVYGALWNGSTDKWGMDGQHIQAGTYRSVSGYVAGTEGPVLLQRIA